MAKAQQFGAEVDLDDQKNAGYPVGGGPRVEAPVDELYEESLEAPDGELKTFSFPHPIQNLRTAFVSGSAQAPGDCSVDDAGHLVFSETASAPAEATHVTALFKPR